MDNSVLSPKEPVFRMLPILQLAPAVSDRTQPDFSTWSSPTLCRCDPVFRQQILEVASELLVSAMTAEAAVFLHSTETSGQTSDPTLVRVELPLGSDDFSNPSWTVSLAEAVHTAIATAQLVGTSTSRDHLRRTRACLSELITLIDHTIDLD